MWQAIAMSVASSVISKAFSSTDSKKEGGSGSKGSMLGKTWDQQGTSKYAAKSPRSGPSGTQTFGYTGQGARAGKSGSAPRYVTRQSLHPTTENLIKYFTARAEAAKTITKGSQIT